MEKITNQHHPEEFKELCLSWGIEYHSTVHHFERNAVGLYAPIFWSDIKAGTLEARE